MPTDVSMAAVGGYYTVGGIKLHLTPLTPEDYAEARAHLKSLSADPMDGIEDRCNKLHVEVAKVLIKEAFNASQERGSLSSTEGRQWATGPDGAAFFLYRQTRMHHPEITMEWCVSECKKMDMKMFTALQEAIADISGFQKPNPSKRTNRKPPRKKR